MDTTAFWTGEAERAAELDLARAEGAAAERARIVSGLRDDHPDEIERHAAADDIEAGRL